ncbi:MAG: transposase family protein, partial [Janthinobacterium lividum]
IPFKARKNHPLTACQKAINQCLAAVRVAVENSIAQLKAFFVLRIENRMRKREKLADAFSLCAELSCFKKCYANT